MIDDFIARDSDGQRVTLRVKRDGSVYDEPPPDARSKGPLEKWERAQRRLIKARERGAALFKQYLAKADKPADKTPSPVDPALTDHVDRRHGKGIEFDLPDGTHMKFRSEGALARWLAVQERIRKSNQEESTAMTSVEKLEAERIAKFKSLNPVAVCKVIVDDNSSHGISEAELVELISNHDRQPGESAAKCFSRHYEAQDDAGLALRKAVQIVKDMPFLADLTPLFVGGEDVNPNDPSKAIAQLQELGRQKWPTATEAQQFANAFTDPANAALAAKAHQRPRPTTSYAFPK